MIAIVTGASRGVGKGIAIGLGEAGATVYVTGRSTGARSPTTDAIGGTIDETAAAVTRAGGKGIAAPCDHAKDDDVAGLFARVAEETGGALDVLVNNAFAIPAGKVRGAFWELPISQWDEMHAVGLRSHFVAAVHAARLMIPRRRGLIVNVSSFGAKVYAVSVAYGVGKAGVDRMSRDMGRELQPHGVACVSIWPGIVRTERLLSAPEAERLGYDPNGPNTESPTFSGRAVAALAKDPNVLALTGKALVVADLAEKYGFRDLDGNLPASLAKTK